MTERDTAYRSSGSRRAPRVFTAAVVLVFLQVAWLLVDASDAAVRIGELAENANAADRARSDIATALLRTGERQVTSPEQARFAQLFAAQAGATQDPNDPATTRWAVLIGINDYHAPTRDNVGSRQDAEDLHGQLLRLGWRSDHIVLLTDHAATRPAIEQAIAWLASKTNGDSVAIFHYSGHTKQWQVNVDSDPEVPDEAIWGADNRYIVDRELVDRLAAVNAGRLWINMGTCEAAGFADPGLVRSGRLLTFSSREPEKSYEDPSVGNSVWGYFLFERGLIGRAGDPRGDDDVTVQEAFHYAAPRATQRTVGQRPHGPQHPVMIDDSGPFSLRIPNLPSRLRATRATGPGR